MTIWDPLIAALDLWQAEGRVARFWLRDDDAVVPRPELSRLLDLGQRYDVPMTLAVVPAHTGEPLSHALAPLKDVNVVLHGWAHKNYAPPDQKQQELGRHRPSSVVLAELAEGVRRLRSYFGDRFYPILVPPWNRIDSGLIPKLAEIGIEGLSTFGSESAGALATVNTHVDIMDWHGTRGCRPWALIVADAVKRLNEMRGGRGAIGLLTHHEVHDEAAWDFIDGFINATKGHRACRWSALPELHRLASQTRFPVNSRYGD